MHVAKESTEIFNNSGKVLIETEFERAVKTSTEFDLFFLQILKPEKNTPEFFKKLNLKTRNPIDKVPPLRLL